MGLTEENCNIDLSSQMALGNMCQMESRIEILGIDLGIKSPVYWKNLE